MFPSTRHTQQRAGSDSSPTDRFPLRGWIPPEGPRGLFYAPRASQGLCGPSWSLVLASPPWSLGLSEPLQGTSLWGPRETDGTWSRKKNLKILRFLNVRAWIQPDGETLCKGLTRETCPAAPCVFPGVLLIAVPLPYSPHPKGSRGGGSGVFPALSATTVHVSSSPGGAQGQHWQHLGVWRNEGLDPPSEDGPAALSLFIYLSF